MRLSLALTVVAISGLTSIAAAEPPPGPRVVTQLEETIVYGRPQGPGVAYILGQSRVRDDQSELRESFVREVPRTVRRAPF